MQSSATRYVTALAIPAIAALGGAAIVYSEYDDAPGGILFGILLIVAAAVLSLRAAKFSDS